MQGSMQTFDTFNEAKTASQVLQQEGFNTVVLKDIDLFTLTKDGEDIKPTWIKKKPKKWFILVATKGEIITPLQA
jgi:hypothetical protein